MPAKHSAVALRTEFPLYSIQCFGGQHMVVAGGGGAAKTGIPNVIETFEVRVCGELIILFLEEPFLKKKTRLLQ